MLRSHAITRADPFSVTMGGQTWYAWEWLYDVVIAGIHHWLGLNGVVFFTAVIIARLLLSPCGYVCGAAQTCR